MKNSFSYSIPGKCKFFVNIPGIRTLKCKRFSSITEGCEGYLLSSDLYKICLLNFIENKEAIFTER